MEFLRELRYFFLANFESNNFAYLLYPFLRIFKLLAFVPIKLERGELLCCARSDAKLKWDCWAVVWSLIAALGLAAGFCVGVHHLSTAEHWAQVRYASLIAYTTNWAQILALFTLGLLSLITSWTNIPLLQRLCSSIARIDYELELWTKERIDYRRLRCCMFLQLGVAVFVPVTMSMVNCVVIQPDRTTRSLTSSCYWFICFLPILLVTLKEFQFYNLLIVLQTKFHCVNEQLRKYAEPQSGYSSSCRARLNFARKVHSMSEIPLTTVTTSALPVSHAEQQRLPLPGVEELQSLLSIYSFTADNVDLVLRIFAWHLLFSTTVSFGVITIQSYNLFAMLMHSIDLKPYSICFIIAWIIVQVLVIGINVGACSMISKTMSVTGPLLHKLRLETHTEQKQFLCQIMHTFSLEVLHRKHSLTAAGFFSMDPKLITSIIAAATTYLVIIIQFHLSNIYKEK